MMLRLPTFRVLYTLLRREFAEHRMMFLYFPAILAALACIVLPTLFMRDPFAEMFGRLLELGSQQGELSGLRQQQILEMWKVRNATYVRDLYKMTEALMLAAFWCSMAYYYLYTLYQQRSNRSILFWNSLPVSDGKTIASKLLAGLVACQLVYMLCLMLVDLSLALTVRLWVSISGVEHWDLYMSRSLLPGNVLGSLFMMPVFTLWALPVYACLLLASAWSRKAPFAWAVGPWLVLVLVELALTKKALLFNKIFEHLIAFGPSAPLTPFSPNEPFPALELVLGALLGLAFVAAAVRFNRSDDT